MWEQQILRVVDVVLDLALDQLRAPTSKPDLLRTESNEHSQRQCKGCDGVCELLRWGEVQRRRDSAYQGCSPPRMIHNSYLELDLCARVSGCDTCRMFRRAFLLEQITGHGAESLEHPDNQWPIYAVLSLRSSGDNALLLAVRSPDDTPFSATIHLSQKPRPRPQNPTRRLPGLRSDLEQLRQVIDDCRHNHGCSSKHRWSHRNPTWLLRILPGNCAQLVEGPQLPVDYVVLSYSWGDPATMPPAEWARIKGAGTKTIGGRPVPERLSPFMVWELPETMQDAIMLAASLGYSYIWIDNVCIPKGTNWDTEAALMHEVYGNAAFTLVASSSTKATDPLIHDRLAWTHRSKACKLRGLWLHHAPVSLDRVRFESPVSQRAWTLQEERLSPRILYWASQRWYWSCAERQVVEMDELQCTAPAADEPPQSCPQRFLELCHIGDEQQLHEEWLDIVEAYTRRDLVEPKDRFLALSGLAVRFYNAKAANGGAAITEDYLAGLWKDNFARHLAWAVTRAVDAGPNLQHIAPSWSWASLPLRVQTRARFPFQPSDHFKFIAVEHIETPSPDFYPGESKQPTATPENTAVDLITRGRAVELRGRGVKVVAVQGRFRRFISEDAREVAWEAIERRRGDRRSFDFGGFPGQHIYARHRADGRILARDAHCGEVVGQLDYMAPSRGGEDDKDAPPRRAPYLPEGAEKELVCLELGESAMLLLVQDRGRAQPESYRRVGVATGYGSTRKGFFYGCETRTIRLV
ncbi:07642a3e-fbd1-42e0-b4b9-dd2e1af6f859 [Thermothielavioides terrestris]|uniref:07642a3e-fbd1-42e0-b4b9-dd2e1af6f859 n=1 Tax=Thermothielavioides terrestris TaxID=2587410 RepID=A0A446BDL3_9PEZI|nr:07642a3e-fbd1-42e0-b4b9-dd2e1af6f859 [Thermothielavioides terrestris]